MSAFLPRLVRVLWFNTFGFPYARVRPYCAQYPVILDYDDYHAALQPRRRRVGLVGVQRVAFSWIKEGATVLDIGCGEGALLCKLKQDKRCAVKGMEISSLAAARVRRRSIEVEVADISRGSFGLSGTWDYIVMTEVLEHLPNPEEVLYKVAKHAKCLILSVPNSAFLAYRLCLLRGYFFTQWIHHPSEHLRYWSHKNFLEWLEAMGLRVLSFVPGTGLGRLASLMPNLFGHQICYLVRGDGA